MASSSSKKLVCFNSTCNETLEFPRQGWRRRTGDYADLCDRCSSAFNKGKFCETYHLNASGWRCCESCGKQIHCGCIVSFHMFILLDAGGIECIDCAKTDYILRPNPAWPAPSHCLPDHAERIRDISAKHWSSIVGTGPVPWRQAPRLFSASNCQPEMLPRTPFEVSMPGGVDRLIASEQLAAFSQDKRKIGEPSERWMNGIMKIGSPEVHGDQATGTQYAGHRNLFGNVSRQSSFVTAEPATPLCGFPITSAAKVQVTDQDKVARLDVHQSTPPLLIVKQFCNNNGTDFSLETQAHNGKPRAETRGRNPLLSRYWPRVTDKELQQISGDLNSKLTPLFEKVLSASDAGRIGRLVLPKKCAEAYLPPISQPEGLPLIVQDLKGKEWVFQFRFWPNNNSRMYVLEGVTPCIQSMHLQAGDTVTFSRLEPEGKLVMGSRKTSTASPSDQGAETAAVNNGISILGDPSTQRHQKGSTTSTMFLPVNQGTSRDPANAWSEVDKSAYIAKEIIGAKVSICGKRKKGSKTGSNGKRLKLDNEEMLELNVSIEQVQGLLRPPPSNVPTVMLLEGIELECYQDAPIIGRPTIFAANLDGENVQWVQCEDCFKWRKVPADALLPSRWTCSDNSWDPDRSVCSAEEELTPEQLDDILPMISQASSKTKKVAILDSEPVEGLDTLADLAIQEREDYPASSQATTKHPRHKPGCTCIVCIQPPSGTKHKPTCMCNVCLTVRRRFQTMSSRRGQKQPEKEPENAETGNSTPNHRMELNRGSDDNQNKKRLSTSPFKSQNIDLNIQPEREEESSPVADDPTGLMRMLQEARQACSRQLNLSANGAIAGDYENGNHGNPDL